MLCDEVIAGKCPGSGCDISRMIPRIAKAQKFVLGPEFAAVADALSSDYTGLCKAFEHCRLPFPEMWIEVVAAERPNFAHASLQIPQAQVRPKRVGFLLTATRPDLSAWKAHLFWSTDLGCSCAALAMKFDMTRPLTKINTLPTAEQEREARSKFLLLRKDIEVHPGWNSATDTVRIAMLQHTDPVLPDYGVMIPPGDFTERELEKFYGLVGELARSDWAGEPGFILAVIGLLCCRNAVETRAVDQARLNKARIKRGKRPLFEHKILKITHRRMTRPAGYGESPGSYAPMREHFVSGHFKTRRTGIFFWHPHVRGYLKRGHIEKDYTTD